MLPRDAVGEKKNGLAHYRGRKAAQCHEAMLQASAITLFAGLAVMMHVAGNLDCHRACFAIGRFRTCLRAGEDQLDGQKQHAQQRH